MKLTAAGRWGWRRRRRRHGALGRQQAEVSSHSHTRPLRARLSRPVKAGGRCERTAAAGGRRMAAQGTRRMAAAMFSGNKRGFRRQWRSTRSAWKCTRELVGLEMADAHGRLDNFGRNSGGWMAGSGGRAATVEPKWPSEPTDSIHMVSEINDGWKGVAVVMLITVCMAVASKMAATL